MTPTLLTRCVVGQPSATDKPSSSPIGLDDGSCPWCRSRLEVGKRRDSRFCGRKCRQAAFRLRRRSAPPDSDASLGTPPTDLSLADPPTTASAEPSPAAGALRFCYADPPYPGLAARYYSNEPEYDGEVDHVALVASLTAVYDGWALSTSARALRDVLPLCPREARVCAWVKPHQVSPRTYGLHNAWEPLIVVEGRRLRPGHADRLVAFPARLGGSDLIGRKPLAFCAWLFECLGMLPGDELVDLFPGSGVVSAAWRELSRAAGGSVVGRSTDDASLGSGRRIGVSA